MAALDFPAAPTDGQLFVGGNSVTYRWSATKGLWLAMPGSAVASPTYDVNNSLMTDPATASSGTTDAPMQITQGQQIFSRTFTALDPSHPIEVDISAMIGLTATAAWVLLGLFIDGAPNAVAQYVTTVNASWASPVRLYWQGVLSPGPHTFTVRFGGYTVTAYLNGASAARYGGGSQRTTMVIRELGVGIQGPQGAPGPPGVSSPILAYHFKEVTGRPILTGTWSHTNVTTPLATSGAAIDSITFTPQSASSVFEIDAVFRGCCGSSDWWNVFCFNGTTFIEQAQAYVYNYNTPLPIFKTILPSVSLAPITLNFRTGADSGTAFYLAAAVGPVYPSGIRSWITVKEMLAS
jgi:hypothetical protein